MGIWNIVQGRPGEYLFYLTSMFYTWITIQLFLTCCFTNRFSWEVCALVCGYECLLVVVVRLKIKALEPVLVWLVQSTRLNLDDDALWALVACKRDRGSSVFLHIILPFLWVSYIRFTVITLMLFLAIDEFFYQFCKSTDAPSWHWAVWDHPLDVCMGGDWLGSSLCVGCLLGVLPTWPW